MRRLVSKKEIHATIKSMRGNTAPRPDGYNIFLYKSTWEIMKQDMYDVLMNFFYFGRILKEINRTFLTLIPKGNDSKFIYNYCPISLCNVTNNLITKVLSSRLKDILPNIVSPSHSSFVKVGPCWRLFY